MAGTRTSSDATGSAVDHPSCPLRTLFAIETRRRDGRTLYFLEIEVAPGVWRQWLLPKEPPLRRGVRRVAIAQADVVRNDLPERTWDWGECTVEAADADLWVLDFGGRRLFGPHVLRRTDSEHWLLLQGGPEENRRVHFALSAGGVVLRPAEDHPIEVVLIRPRGRRYWTLPKGTVEPEEALPETALREVAEETGVAAEILRPLDPIEYWFWGREDNRKVRIHKAVAYYLMRAHDVGELTATREVETVEWFSASDVLDRLSHGTERAVVRQGLAAWSDLDRRDP